MTKHEEIISAFNSGWKQNIDYRNDRQNFIKEFIDKLSTYLECEKRYIRFDLLEDMELDKDKCFFNIKVALQTGEIDPRKPKNMLLKFILKKENEEWIISLDYFLSEFKINATTFEGCDKFIEFIVRFTIKYYENIIDHFEERDKQPNLGFISD